MPRPNPARSTGSLGPLLFAATDAFIREKLGPVHAGGFGRVTEVHMALIQNLDLQGTRPTLLAARAQMTKQGMLEMVDRAATLGFVEQQADPVDRRAKVVRFTPAGLRMLERLRLGVGAAEQRMDAVMGAAFVATMKERLSAYTASSQAAVTDGEALPTGNGLWRTRNAGRILASTARAFHRDVMHVVHGGGFAAATAVQLKLIGHFDAAGSRVTDIAVRARMTKQAVTEAVDRFEAGALVARKPDPADGRAKIVTLTARGAHLLTHLRHGNEVAERRFAERVGRTFGRELRGKLEGYVDSIR